jgi:hypothetical protein
LRQAPRLVWTVLGPSLRQVHLPAWVRQAWLREQTRLLQVQRLVPRSSRQPVQLPLASSALV